MITDLRGRRHANSSSMLPNYVDTPNSNLVSEFDTFRLPPAYFSSDMLYLPVSIVRATEQLYNTLPAPLSRTRRPQEHACTPSATIVLQRPSGTLHNALSIVYRSQLRIYFQPTRS